MDLVVRPSGPVVGRCRVPGDKSIAHRWLILGATAVGRTRLEGLPASEDVRSTARVLGSVLRICQPELHGWDSKLRPGGNGEGFTSDADGGTGPVLELRGVGRGGIATPDAPLDCGNSGTTMRLMAGVLAGAPVHAELIGDASLARRPMERIAAPLRAMGARVTTADGHAPVGVDGGALHGVELAVDPPSAQVKGAILLAGCAATGQTVVRESVRTRDHTERALLALGGPVSEQQGVIGLTRFQHEGFSGRVPGDVSSAAFLIAAAALTGGVVEIDGVGLNPSRIAYLDVMRRMGVEVEVEVTGLEVGEPMGRLRASGGGALRGAQVSSLELPLLIDEVPVLAALAAHAEGPSKFEGAGELRVKESDRLGGFAERLSALGAVVEVEGDSLMLGGGGVAGGVLDPAGDHRIAMAGVILGLRARAEVTVLGADCAAVSFPGFAPVLVSLGADLRA